MTEWSACFQGKPFNITVIQVYVPINDTEEAEVERFYEDLQDFLELTPQKHVLFIIGDWNAKVGSQETPGRSEVKWSEVKWCEVKSLSCVWFFETPWNSAYQAPLPMGILQARILEWVAICFSRGSS